MIMFVYNTYKLNKMIGLNYDQDALQKGVIGSVVMASIIFALNFYLPLPYYLPLKLLIGSLFYLLFLRFTRAYECQRYSSYE